MDNQLEREVSSQLERDLDVARAALEKFGILGTTGAYATNLIALADLIGKERRWRSSPGLGEGE